MNNKICLVLACNLYAAPFYYRYEKLLNSLLIDFDLIIWNRDLIEEKSSGNVILFNLKDIANSGDKKKIIKYFRFASFVKKRLKLQNYQRVIFLSTASGVVAILSLFLKSNYKNRYWIDIRDYTYEEFKPYKLAFSIAINNSYASSISSVGFTKFLPKSNYIVTHNIDFDSIKKCLDSKYEKIQGMPIRISFIGNVRYFELNKKMLQIFKNDSRFILQYFGKKSEILEEYCRTNKIYNVEFYGRFDVEMTAKFYAKTHIINNVYGNDRLEVTTALSNKLYFAASLHMPILVSSNTYMEEVAKKYKFGYTMNLDDPTINDKLFKWYTGLAIETCKYDEFMEQVIKEYQEFEEKLVKFFTGI